MQDKIQEIMVLMDALSVDCVSFGIGQVECSAEDRAYLGEDVKKARALLQSKLRELVREPLSDEEIEKATGVKRGTPMFLAATGFVRATERAHGITNTSN